MIHSTSEVKIKKNIDYQKQSMYSFDNIIHTEISHMKHIPVKLYRDLPKGASLQELSFNIAEDFGLGSGLLKTSKAKNYSYYDSGSIYLLPHVLKENDLEVLLHEYAHFFVDIFFNTYNESDHGGEYVAAFRFLLNHYDIVTNDIFDECIENYAEDLDLYVDFIETFEFLSFEDLMLRKSKAKSNEIKDNISHWCSYLNFNRDVVKTEKEYEMFLSNHASKKYIYIKLNQRAYEYDHPFVNLSVSDINKTIILSNVFIIDEDGNPCSSLYGEHGFASYKASKSFEVDEFDKIEKVYFYFGERHYANRIGFFDLNNKEEFKPSSKEARSALKEEKTELEKKGFNIVCAKSIKEFTLFREQLDLVLKTEYRRQLKESQAA